jgi:hypothetical protein
MSTVDFIMKVFDACLGRVESGGRQVDTTGLAELISICTPYKKVEPELLQIAHQATNVKSIP